MRLKISLFSTALSFQGRIKSPIPTPKVLANFHGGGLNVRYRHPLKLPLCVDGNCSWKTYSPHKHPQNIVQYNRPPQWQVHAVCLKIRGFTHRPHHIINGFFARQSAVNFYDVHIGFVQCRTNHIVHTGIRDGKITAFVTFQILDFCY
ncbi:Uncharacterised protein [Rodentibacter pneumotropicus]|uniref:Uncharacterized protein n=1 Tax=Rodentibacter pneumotropicus TaxID=758 RepID=A0A3S4VBG5_9PAST|nr:Uncharacterised protein [Rodentibacter pneumotropicus]